MAFLCFFSALQGYTTNMDFANPVPGNGSLESGIEKTSGAGLFLAF
jgi:hypothetical protein